MIPNLTTLLSRLPAPKDREAIRKAHDAAQRFHAAMAEALEAEIELENRDNPDRGYWAESYQMALGAAAVAMEKMPIKWLAVLEV